YFSSHFTISVNISRIESTKTVSIFPYDWNKLILIISYNEFFSRISHFFFSIFSASLCTSEIIFLLTSGK
ncbi:TPA: hypothetical protein DEG21_00685, partial [Patescibacteria group bacterium]|nr:hypothetical protein [Candidatus Gracilibacteria bacterium]